MVIADGRRGTRVRAASARRRARPPLAAAAAACAISPTAIPIPRSCPTRAGRPPRPPASAVRRLSSTIPSCSRLAREQFAATACRPTHVAVASGALDGIERVLREHLRAGDRVAVEDPCFTGVLDLLHALALDPVPGRCRRRGICSGRARSARSAATLRRSSSRRAPRIRPARRSRRAARAPSRHFCRRREILVIEDDHAGSVAGAAYLTLVSSTDRALGGRPLGLQVSRPRPPRGADRRRRQTMPASSRGRPSASAGSATSCNASWHDAPRPRDQPAPRGCGAHVRGAAPRPLARAAGARHRRARRLGTQRLDSGRRGASVVQALLQRGWAVKAGERYRIATPPAIRVTDRLARAERRGALRRRSGGRHQVARANLGMISSFSRADPLPPRGRGRCAWLLHVQRSVVDDERRLQGAVLVREEADADGLAAIQPLRLNDFCT